jgi:predicted dehydrogenase
MEPLRLGFIGAGSFATWTLYPALYLAPIALQAVCDIDAEKARSVAGKFGTGRWYTDRHDMYEKEDLEAVIICMGPGPRQALVREALETGYHVFVPKPPALSLADSIELAEVARRAGKTLMVNFQRRFSLGVRRAKEIMADDPAFGQLTQLQGSFCSGKYDAVRGAGYADPIQAYLLDFAIHHFDLARYIGGEVKKLSGFHNEIGGQGAFAVALEFANGAVGTLQLNAQRIWWRNYDRIEITGRGAYIVLDGLWNMAYYTESQNTFTENYSDQRNEELTGDAYSLIEFAAAIREGREPIASIHDCLETMRLYEAVLARREGVIRLHEG